MLSNRINKLDKITATLTFLFLNIFSHLLCWLYLIFCILRFYNGTLRSSHQKCYIKKVFLEISQNSQESTCVRVFFLQNISGDCFCKHSYPLQFPIPAGRTHTKKKEALAQMFSCEFCEISKNTFFKEHLRTTASVPWNTIGLREWF